MRLIGALIEGSIVGLLFGPVGIAIWLALVVLSYVLEWQGVI